ncbi:AAA family ATPase [Candidatus Woesearchaeota archaeon]|nr:AAA family ATPase [Candidatus Woesearchaeota archaeon]
MGKIVGVISIKGGVGKTTTVANLGAVLSHEFGQKVLVVDANFSAANLGLHFGLVNPEATLQDVMVDKKRVWEVIYEYWDNFHIIPSHVVPKKVNPLKLKGKLNLIKDKYDIILIDSSPSLNEEILATMIAADELLVISSPDYPTLSCTIHAVKIAKRQGTPITGIILNKVRNKEFEVSTEDVEAATGTPVIGVLPDDVNLLAALSQTRPAVEHDPYSDAVIEYKKIAAAMAGQSYDDPRFTAKLRRIFSKDIPKEEVNRQLLREGLLNQPPSGS